MSTPPPALEPPNDGHAEWLLWRIWRRVNRENKHFMGCIVGEEGSGKSWTAMRIAEAVDPTFSADRAIFDVVDLLKILRDGDHEPGNFYLLDEAGVQLGRRSWQERGQILVNQALQIVRDENLGLIFTLPRLSELDTQAQGRLQAFYEIVEKVEDEYVRGKWKFMDPDRTDTTGEIYKKFPRRRRNGRVTKIKDFAFTPPSAEITDPYQERKGAFQEKVYRETIEELEGDENDGDDAEEQLGPADVVSALKNGDDLADVVSYHGTTGEPYIDETLIRFEYELSTRDSKTAKKLLQRDDEIDPSRIA